MALQYNGIKVDKIFYNGIELDSVVYNGATVWESAPPAPEVKEITHTWEELDAMTLEQVKSNYLTGSWKYVDIDNTQVKFILVDYTAYGTKMVFMSEICTGSSSFCLSDSNPKSYTVDGFDQTANYSTMYRIQGGSDSQLDSVVKEVTVKFAMYNSRIGAPALSNTARKYFVPSRCDFEDYQYLGLNSYFKTTEQLEYFKQFTTSTEQANARKKAFIGSSSFYSYWTRDCGGNPTYVSKSGSFTTTSNTEVEYAYPVMFCI